VIRGLKQRGFEVHFFLLWWRGELPLRVEDGFAGGHDVPEAVVRRFDDRSQISVYTAAGILTLHTTGQSVIFTRRGSSFNE